MTSVSRRWIGPAIAASTFAASMASPASSTRVAADLQGVADHRADMGFVVYEQNRLRSRSHGSLAVLSLVLRIVTL